MNTRDSRPAVKFVVNIAVLTVCVEPSNSEQQCRRYGIGDVFCKYCTEWLRSCAL